MGKFLLVFLVLLFFNGCLHRKSSKEFDQVLSKLTNTEIYILDTFFRTLFEKSQGGYVLFGNKPICVEAFPYREEGTLFLPRELHSFTTKLKKGVLLWKHLNLNRFSKNYFLCTYEEPVFEKWNDFILINKPLFLKTVHSNLSLFQYVLGPKVTPEALFEQIVNSRKSFHSILKNDKVLIGILLGYGTQNAIYGSRSEAIIDVPSFGFESIGQEIAYLKEIEHTSIEQGGENQPALPWFGWYDENESKGLLSEYKKTQLVLSRILTSKSFLSSVLSQFFDSNVVISKEPELLSNTLFPRNEVLIQVVANCIWQSIDKDERDPEYFALFCSGMEATESGQKPIADQEYRDLVIQYVHQKSDKMLRRQVAFNAGLIVWDHFKHGQKLYTYTQIKKLLDECMSGEISFDPIDAQVDQILVLLHLFLYENKMKKLIGKGESQKTGAKALES